MTPAAAPIYASSWAPRGASGAGANLRTPMTPGEDIEARMAGLEGETRARLQAAERDVASFERWIGDVETRLGRRLDEVKADVGQSITDLKADVGAKLETLGRAIDSQNGQRAEARSRIILAVIAGSFTVIAAIIAAAAAIFTHAA